MSIQMYEPLKQVNLGLKSFYQAGMSVTHVTAAAVQVNILFYLQE